MVPMSICGRSCSDAQSSNSLSFMALLTNVFTLSHGQTTVAATAGKAIVKKAFERLDIDKMPSSKRVK